MLVEEGRLAVADLVEDELLLAVPQVPRNPDVERVLATTASPEGSQAGASASKRADSGAGDGAGDIGAEGADSGGDRQRPFEGLAEMIKSK